MAKIIDVSKLGEREVTRRVIVTETNPETGMKHMTEKPVAFVEAQPILTPEEASVLAEEEWVETSKALRVYGKYMCKVARRRFFCSEKPKQPKAEHKSESKKDDK